MESIQVDISPLKVSVIVPAYNAARTIAQTLESLLAQTYSEWEAVVVDDGSTDATGRIVRGFVKRDSRFRMVTRQNGGESAARNTGIAKAQYDWLLFLDADDWISPVHLEKMTSVLASDRSLDAVHCGYARVAADGTEVLERYQPPIGDLFPTLARRAAFPVHACLVRKALVTDVGMFDTSLRTSPDWDLWQRVARTGANFGAVREVLAFYRMSPHSASLDASQLFKDGLRVLRQGQTHDPRVRRPHPEHAGGLANERVETQEFYLLCWCAGLLLGSGQDARPLLELVGDDRYPELYPDAVAQSVFESVPLPSCQPPNGWEDLWPRVQDRVAEFFAALEKQSTAPDLARIAMGRLKRMIVEASPTWNLFSEQMQALATPLREERESWQRLAEAREHSLSEQQALMERLRQSQALVAEERGTWQQLAEARERSVSEYQRLVEELRRSHKLLVEAREGWQQVAEERAHAIAEQQEIAEQLERSRALLERNLGDERAGRMLVERQLRRRDKDLQEVDSELRKRDDELLRKTAANAGLEEELRVTEASCLALQKTLQEEEEAGRRAARQRAHLEETIDWTRAEMARVHEASGNAENAHLEQAGALRQRLELAESAVRDRERRHAQEISQLRSSPEWRVGDTLWNAVGVSRIGRPAAQVVRRLQDRRTRGRLSSGSRARQDGRTRHRAVVAACWSFPIPSQTFVYQEMQALEWAGLDCQVFCCETNAKEGLPEAFESLWPKRVVLKSDWSLNQGDLEHFLHTRPERVEALLVRLGQATGLTRDALLQESIVMMGFTFARHVELSGADYLHTYFFYDQSFMALMAAYLLQIPRGITVYADHMMNDYPFKCVPLHLELADIVVATSQRIKSELSTMGGGRFDDKILVKPNGIDTARFPYVAAADRLASGPEPELISVSRIEPKKGLIYLIEALGILKARGIAVRLNVVGGVDQHTATSADCFREIATRIDELGLSDRVVLHGTKRQSEFVPLLARSRIFMAPYVEVASGDKDGIPTALLEAMSTGLPVIATDAGSILEAATADEALSVPQRDPPRLADAIERLLQDKALYVTMSEAARRRAVSVFDAHVTERTLHERILSRLSGLRPQST